MLNFPLHTERTDIIAGAFNSQYTAKLVIHFYGHITHVVLDPRSEDALIIVCANLFGTVISDSLSKESGDVVRLHSIYRSVDDFIIDWCQVFRLTEHDIRGTFDLLNRPGITQPERFRNGTVASGKDIENFMEPLRVDTVRKFLSSFNIGDFKERVVLHSVRKLFFVKLIGEQVMTVHVKLKTERRPCRDTKIAKAKFPVDKIEIVMKTLALVKLQEGLPSCFIMPGPVGITAFHSRKDMDQTFRFSGFGNDVLDAVIFSKSMEFSDELNFRSIFVSNLFRILTDLFRKGLGETGGIIKNTDTVEFHIGSHCFRMAPVWDISLNDHAVITGNDAMNFISVFISE